MMSVQLCMIVVLASCAAPCGQWEKEKTKMSSSLHLTTTVVVKGHDLVLRYEVANDDHRDVYLLNRLSRSNKISPDVIYVRLDEATETILLSKKVADLPEGLSPTVPVAPFVSPLRAGTSFSEEIRIRIPVHCYYEYLTPDDSRGELRMFRHVLFALGYYWRPAGAREKTQNIGGVSVILPIFVGGPEFGELHSERTRIDVPVVVPK
jgi:hypothetical protein